MDRRRQRIRSNGNSKGMQPRSQPHSYYVQANFPTIAFVFFRLRQESLSTQPIKSNSKDVHPRSPSRSRTRTTRSLSFTSTSQRFAAHLFPPGWLQQSAIILSQTIPRVRFGRQREAKADKFGPEPISAPCTSKRVKQTRLWWYILARQRQRLFPPGQFVHVYPTS
ncbi:hypothetical protein FA15DRAFT_671770 [Coprinopsis marcescibilis]|uniref:Uncharacterized protein n=1 Tax=Coprinopsis marcescibilis TaxID=230819 RepID=A0A5C3KQZ2_COPMA|nr:hypothetical protein FA15DRAFT_671770 [Coprinopsis marcescibilis]